MMRSHHPRSTGAYLVGFLSSVQVGLRACDDATLLCIPNCSIKGTAIALHALTCGPRVVDFTSVCLRAESINSNIACYRSQSCALHDYASPNDFVYFDSRILTPLFHLIVSSFSRRTSSTVSASNGRVQIIKPINGDPFIGMLETPVTSSPDVANFLSNLPAYRTGVAPLLRGVEVGLAHGFFLTGPFIKLGPLRATDAAELAGCLSGAGLVLILTACLSIYGATAFQRDEVVGVKTLSGRTISKDPLQSADGWASFTSGWLVGGLSGVAWSFILTQVLPYYS